MSTILPTVFFHQTRKSDKGFIGYSKWRQSYSLQCSIHTADTCTIIWTLPGIPILSSWQNIWTLATLWCQNSVLQRRNQFPSPSGGSTVLTRIVDTRSSTDLMVQKMRTYQMLSFVTFIRNVEASTTKNYYAKDTLAVMSLNVWTCHSAHSWPSKIKRWI